MPAIRLLSGCLLLVIANADSQEVVSRASALYQRTEYENSLHVLAEDPAQDEGTPYAAAS